MRADGAGSVARHHLGALSLATVFGLFSIIAGISALVLSARARHISTITGQLANTPT